MKINKLLNIYPSEWNSTLDIKNTNIHQFRNLLHFKTYVKGLTQKEDDKCGVTYKTALTQLLKDTPQISEGNYEIVKNTVKENLLKRGLITNEIYESYKYDIEGEIWDVGKVIAEDPACFLVPNTKYKEHFYELYVSISYPYHVINIEVLNSMAKILATIELLEKEHLYCKVSLVLPIQNCGLNGKPHYLGLIPLFGHKDNKSITTMSAVLNDRLLRKFFFAILEDLYKNNLAEGYGIATDLAYTIKPVNINEVELASSIINRVIN